MSSTSHLVIVRHGQSVANVEKRFGGHTDTPLTPFGVSQAEAAAAALSNRSIQRLYSSDIVRAKQTASPIAAALGLPIQTDRRLRERTVGVFDGMEIGEFEKNHPDSFAKMRSERWEFTAPQGENATTVYARIQSVLDEVSKLNGTTVLVSHGIAIFFMLLKAAGVGAPHRQTKFFALVENCSFSEFSIEPDGIWRLRRFNDTAHLSELVTP